MMDLTDIIKMRTIDFVPSSLTAATPFPDQPDLRNAHVVGLKTWTPDDIALTPANNLTMMLLADMKKIVLLLKEGEVEICYNVPLMELHTMQNANDDPFERTPFKLADKTLTWDKCKAVPQSALSTVAGAISLGVYYWLDEDMDAYLYNQACVIAKREMYVNQMMARSTAMPQK